MPFLLAIKADPVDEVNYVFYADWLEEHSEVRSRLLRLLARFLFSQDELPVPESTRTRTLLQVALRETSIAWLHQLFGTAARVQEITQSVQDTTQSKNPTGAYNERVMRMISTGWKAS
jgi:uncharacterized protein (TIGR02996 family)